MELEQILRQVSPARWAQVSRSPDGSFAASFFPDNGVVPGNPFTTRSVDGKGLPDDATVSDADLVLNPPDMKQDPIEAGK